MILNSYNYTNNPIYNVSLYELTESYDDLIYNISSMQISHITEEVSYDMINEASKASLTIIKVIGKALGLLVKLIAKAIDFYKKAKSYIVSIFKKAQDDIKKNKIRNVDTSDFKEFEYEMKEYNSDYASAFKMINVWYTKLAAFLISIYVDAIKAVKNPANNDITQRLSMSISQSSKNIFDMDDVNNSEVNKLIDEKFYKSPEKKTVKITKDYVNKITSEISKDESNSNKLMSLQDNIGKVANISKTKLQNLQSNIPKDESTLLDNKVSHTINNLINKTQSYCNILIYGTARATNLFIEKVNVETNILTKIYNSKKK